MSPVDFNSQQDLDDDAQTVGTEDEAHAAQIESRLKELHTCLPGIIISFDPVKQTAVVQPVIKRVFTGGATNLPPCGDVPVSFPRGGGLVLTFPVKKGDECIIWFSERAIDAWWKLGGVQLPTNFRYHDLSDGLCMVGIASQPNVVPNFDAERAQLRTLDGTVSVTVDPAGTITLKGAVVIDGTLDVKDAATFEAPVTCEEAVTVEGPLAAEDGIAITGNATGAGGDINIVGNVIATGEGTFNGHTVGEHHHTGVQTGSGTSGPPTG